MNVEIYPYYVRNPVSAGLHLLWCLWALYASALLYRLAGRDPVRRRSILIFGASMVLLYAASGVYHAVPANRPDLVEFFRLVDHSAIYALIAGTYTPIFAILLAGSLRNSLLATMWTLAAVGIACKWLIPLPPYPLTVGLYIGLGWMGLLAVPQLIRALGVGPMRVALTGGLLYTLGAISDAVRWPIVWPGIIGPHEVLHVFDMAGTLLFVVFIMRYVLPYRQRPGRLIPAFATAPVVETVPSR